MKLVHLILLGTVSAATAFTGLDTAYSNLAARSKHLKSAIVCSHKENTSSSVSLQRRSVLLLGIAAVTAAPLSATAQRPPPRPKLTSVPEECKQSGQCGGMGQDPNAGDGLPQFKSADGTAEVLDPKGGRYTTGLKVQDVAIGDKNSPVIENGRSVSVQYVLRRANGYFVDASYGFDRFDTLDFKMGQGLMVPGFEQALQGMHQGGRRRFVVPPNLGYTQGVGDGKPGPMPTGWGERRALDSHRREPLIFEVLVVKVK